MVTRVIDAENHILGRLASHVAKMLLLGERVIVVNSEKAIISGNRRKIIEFYKERSNIHTHTNPLRGPFWPKRPDNLLRRTIRGMLPWKKKRGRQAYKRLKVFQGIPERLNLDETTFTTFTDASIDNLKGTFIEVSELSQEIGYKPMK
ncbi:MAG: 50S ribosomal protein L13 [Candidatus Helarchaeota archaeon]